MPIRSGLSANTQDNLLLDAGAFYKNYDIDTHTGTLLGATRGGGEFKAVPAIRQIEVDGARGPVKGLKRIDSWDISLKLTLLEITAEQLKLALVSANIDSSGADHDLITLNNDISESDYVDNIAWVGTSSGSAEPVVIIIDNALGMEGITIPMADKGEGTLPITLQAHYDVGDLDTVPCRIYYPKVQSNTTAPTVTTVPLDAAIAVAVGSTVKWTFSESIQQQCITAANFFVLAAVAGTIVSGALTANADRTVVTFTPGSNLSAATAYVAIATTNVKDSAGNALATNSITNFTTA